MIKDVQHSVLSEEESCSTSCFDSLLCVGEVKTQIVQGQKITSIALLKFAVAFYPEELLCIHSMERWQCRGVLPLNSLRFIKKALLFQCIGLLFKKS